jgi:hypothetical protein
MSFRWAYCAFTLALVIAACGKKEEPAATSVPESLPASTAAGAAALGALGAAAGGNVHPEMKKYVAGLTKISDALASVRDEATAKTAAQQIAAANAELEPLQKTIDGWSEADKQAAVLANTAEFAMISQKIAVAAANLQASHPELMQTLGTELDKMPDLK